MHAKILSFADYIEPDLCLSKDGVFVVMHDLLLDETTNVADFAEFKSKYTTKVVDGKNMTGYFINDFLLAELKLLRLNQRLAFRSNLYDGLFELPTFDEVMSLAQSSFNETARMVGIYPELKHPSFFRSLGFPMEDMLLESLQKGGYATTGASAFHDLKNVVPVVIQCFETASLQYLSTRTQLPLVLLVDLPSTTEAALSYLNITTLTEISGYAQGVGPNKNSFGPTNILQAKEIVSNAHALGLFLHPWTFRADSGIISSFNNDFEDEEYYFLSCLGMDGVFSEFPDRTRETIDLTFGVKGGRGGC
jgi:glycerophosphoryl diester phosphodiesterase